MNQRHQADAIHLFERRLDARPRWLHVSPPRLEPRSLVVGRHISGLGASCRRPVSRRDLDLHVRYEIRHIVFDLLDRDAFAHPCPPCSGAECSKHQVLSVDVRAGCHLLDFRVQLELVGDQHLAGDAQTAGLPQQHEAE